MNYEDFVTYEQAVALKELGFDYKCFSFYTCLGILGVEHLVYDEGKIIYEDYNNDVISNCYNVKCSAPTLAQAQKWLREAKGIHIQPKICLMRSDWYAQLIKGLSYYPKITCATDYFGTYEQALSAGIDKALELLKQQSNGNQD